MITLKEKRGQSQNITFLYLQRGEQLRPLFGFNSQSPIELSNRQGSLKSSSAIPVGIHTLENVCYKMKINNRKRGMTQREIHLW